MKNSKRSQIAVLIVLVISLILSFLLRKARLGSSQGVLADCLIYGLFVITICTIIYYIVFSKKKIISIAVSIVAIVIDIFAVYSYAMNAYFFGLFIKEVRFHVISGGVFYLLLIIFAALLVTFMKNDENALVTFFKKDKTAKSTKPQETKGNYAQPDTTVSSEIYCSLLKHILLLLFTFGIWNFIWVYRMTGYTNAVEGEEYRNPTKKLLLCMFVPFYSVYWTYKTAQRVDKMAAAKGVSSDMTTLCLILAIFVAIIPPILLQDVMNKIATADNTQPVSDQKAADVKETKIDTADELKKFKELLDSGVITQEEFDTKKKQLLGL